MRYENTHHAMLHAICFNNCNYKISNVLRKEFDLHAHCEMLFVFSFSLFKYNILRKMFTICITYFLNQLHFIVYGAHVGYHKMYICTLLG